jgi:hypothetical protein
MVIPSESAVADDEGPLHDFDSPGAAPFDFEGAVLDSAFSGAPFLTATGASVGPLTFDLSASVAPLFYPFHSNEPTIYIET